MDWSSLPLMVLAGSYLLVNLVALVMYGFDKFRARKGGRRVPERDLLLVALLGPFGALAGMRVFRHKTRKAMFVLVPLFAVLHLVAFLFLLY